MLIACFSMDVMKIWFLLDSGSKSSEKTQKSAKGPISEAVVAKPQKVEVKAAPRCIFALKKKLAYRSRVRSKRRTFASRFLSIAIAMCARSDAVNLANEIIAMFQKCNGEV